MDALNRVTVASELTHPEYLKNVVTMRVMKLDEIAREQALSRTETTPQ